MVAPVNPGDILADKYRVDTILGIGGMGVVVSAEHIELSQKVAVKFMLPTMLDNEEAVERFLREARAAVRLRSEHVARVLDVGRLDNNAPYIIMEFLEGEDLYDYIRKYAPCSPATAIDIILQACKAMAEAHSLGIIHRDLKPANLFMSHRPDGSQLVKVLDFGISKLLEESNGVCKTKTSVALGSPAYMSPEQMRSAKHVDKRADIWSLGAILYQMLSKSLPFEAESPPEMFAKVLGDDPTPLQSVVPDIDPDLAAIVHMCLAKDRNERFASVSQFAKALAPFGDENAVSLAISIANVENDHSEPPPRASTSTSDSEDGEDGVGEAVVAVTAQMGVNAKSKANTVTTHSNSTGQIVAEGLDPIEPALTNRTKMYWAGGAIALTAAVLLFTRMSGGSDSNEVNSAAATPIAPEAIVVPVVPPVETTPQPLAAIDAGIPEANVPDAQTPDAQSPDATQRLAKPTKTGRPRRPKKPDKLPVEPKKPKKPVDADPFGTMQ
ncbi:MAG: serine/threonine protein kinase [Kofleriaceae bacterium]|nr:serine/threonine protein kinase [Kofleriaceae bacterium]